MLSVNITISLRHLDPTVCFQLHKSLQLELLGSLTLWPKGGTVHPRES